MNLVELQNELARWGYKPGWRLEIVSDPVAPGWHRYALLVRYDADDSRSPGRKIQIASRQQLPGEHIRDSEEFARVLRQIVLDIEEHEMREWLHRDGQIFDDPHKAEVPQ